MGLETGSHIPELDDTNPTGADPKSQGDDHLRLLKRCTKGSFPAFVGTEAVPKSVALTEDQINDAALKSEAQTITEIWRHEAALALANNVQLTGQNVADDAALALAHVNLSDVAILANNDVNTQVRALDNMDFRLANVTQVKIVARALGALLVKDMLGNDRKAGFRNPQLHAENAAYTLQQSDEGAVVRRSTGNAITYTVPVLESFTTVTVINDAESTLTLAADGVTMLALIGGADLTAPIFVAPRSVVQLWWVATGTVRVWGNGISN